MLHSVWAYTNILPFFTFQPYSWTLLCNGSCITYSPDIPSNSRHCIPLNLPKAIPRPRCAAALAYVTFCLSLHKQPPILHILTLFLDSVVQRVLQKSYSVWHSVYIPKDVFLMSEPEAGHGRELGMLLWRVEVKQSKMADWNGNGATRHRSMPCPSLTTPMPLTNWMAHIKVKNRWIPWHNYT